MKKESFLGKYILTVFIVLLCIFTCWMFLMAII